MNNFDEKERALEEIFEGKVARVLRRPDLGPCLEWKSAARRIVKRRQDGELICAYGPARKIWIMAFGKPIAGLCVCHHCDNPACIRLSHLFVGTRRDNMQDMTRKKRHAVSEVALRGGLSSEELERLLTDLPIRVPRHFGQAVRYHHARWPCQPLEDELRSLGTKISPLRFNHRRNGFG